MSGFHAVLVANAFRTVKLSSTAASGAVAPGGTSTATFELQSTGAARKSTFGVVGNITGEWLLSGAVSQFEARGTWGAGSGTISGPTTYSNLSTTRTWTFATTGTDDTRTLTVDIRNVATGTVVATAVITMNTFGS